MVWHQWHRKDWNLEGTRIGTCGDRDGSACLESQISKFIDEVNNDIATTLTLTLTLIIPRFDLQNTVFSVPGLADNPIVLADFVRPFYTIDHWSDKKEGFLWQQTTIIRPERTSSIASALAFSDH